MFANDVQSLFANDPLAEIVDYLYTFIETSCFPCRIPVELLKMLLLCLQDIGFWFGETFYRQIDGVALRRPIGPFLAYVFVGMVEDKAHVWK